MPDDIEATGAPSIDSARLRQVGGRFATGVAVVTTLGDDRPFGFTAQSFVSLSLEPPLVAVCPNAASSTLPHVRASGVFCVNVLTDRQEALSRTFASKDVDKFRGVGWRSAVTGAPVLDDVLAWIDCRLEAEHPAGDHVILVGRVTELDVGDDAGAPLLFYRGGYGRFEP